MSIPNSHTTLALLLYDHSTHLPSHLALTTQQQRTDPCPHWLSFQSLQLAPSSPSSVFSSSPELAAITEPPEPSLSRTR
ncbi:unnamed protein product [Cutaneotrichosporon oleaginosum]